MWILRLWPVGPLWMNDGEVDVTLDAAQAARALVFGACKLVLAR